MSATCAAVRTAVPVNRSLHDAVGAERASTISRDVGGDRVELVGRSGDAQDVRAAGEDRAAQQPVAGDLGR